MKMSLGSLRPMFILLLIFGIYILNETPGRHEDSGLLGSSLEPTAHEARAYDVLGEAFRAGRSDVLVVGEGAVEKVLRDDEKGSRHQRFLLTLESGQSVLIAHNIDLAPRIPDLKRGDVVRFKGEYEWNERGGVVHWTHRDPDGKHAPGWLRRDGQRYD